jgi:phosphoheptose isomerase
MSAALLQSAFDEAIALHQRVKDADPRPVIDAAAAIVDALGRGGKLLLFGNGGSAADAQHVAAELVGRFTRERVALAAIALTTDTSVLTSVGNDYAFDRVFARQVEALGRPGDVALGISTSGASPNVVAALEAARALRIHTIALTGRDGGAVGRAAAIHLNVPSDVTARVQEVHRTLLHVICAIVEQSVLDHGTPAKDIRDTKDTKGTKDTKDTKE